MKNREQILTALSFWSLFDKGLETEDLARLANLSSTQITKILPTLGIKRKNQNWYLNSYQPINQKTQNQQTKLIKKYLPLLRFVPGIRAVAVCNSYSLKTTTSQSDIDLLIVAQPNLLFSVRLLVTTYFQLVRKRRHHSIINNRFCLSFFVTTNNLNFSSLLLEKDYYFYYWFRTLQWYILPNSKDKWQHLLFEQNKSWLKKFGNETEDGLFAKSNWLTKVYSQKLSENLIKIFCEPLLKSWQLKRAQNKQQQLGNPSGVLITAEILKFHVIDKRNELNHQLEKILKTLQKT